MSTQRVVLSRELKQSDATGTSLCNTACKNGSKFAVVSMLPSFLKNDRSSIRLLFAWKVNWCHYEGVKSTFTLKAPFAPAGDQPKAIEGLVSGIQKNLRRQTLLGVTGSGKTMTAASVIAKTNM